MKAETDLLDDVLDQYCFLFEYNYDEVSISHEQDSSVPHCRGFILG